MLSRQAIFVKRMVVFNYTPLAGICSAAAHKRGLLGKRRISQQARKAFTFLFVILRWSGFVRYRGIKRTRRGMWGPDRPILKGLILFVLLRRSGFVRRFLHKKRAAGGRESCYIIKKKEPQYLLWLLKLNRKADFLILLKSHSNICTKAVGVVAH